MLIGTRGSGRRFAWRMPPGEFRSVTIVERAVTPACVLAPNGVMVAANAQLEALLGARSGGLSGRPLLTLVYPPDSRRAKGVLAAVFADGVDRHQVDQRCVRLDDQQVVWGAWDLSLVRDVRGRPEFAIAMVRDLTEIRQAEQERRFFEFMLKVIGEAEDSDSMLGAAIQTICHFTRCAMGQVWLPASGGLVCSPSWYAGWYGFDQLRAASEPRRYARGDGLPGLVWASGEPMLVRDAHEQERFDRAVPAGKAGVRDALAVPITTSSGVIAVLEFFVSSDRAAEPGRLERIAKVVGELGSLFERRLAEEALRASEERFRGVTSAATDAIVSADAEGRLRSWNRGAERMFGWRPDEVVGLPLAVIIPERFRAAHDAGIARVRSTGISKLAGQVVELMGLHKDGHEFPVELSIGAWTSTDGLTFSGVIRDITERKMAEDVLRASEERFRRVTDAATDAIVSAGADGRLRSWNGGAERMFGWRAEEVIGSPLTVIVPERFRAAHEAGIARVGVTGTSKLAGQVVELTALHKDGHEFPIELSIGAWSDADGMTFSGIVRDITQRKQAEEAIAAANRELERTNAELETLVYSASHDLKSPMVSLLGYLEYLKVDFGEALGEEGNRYVERISGCTLYMQRLIHDLIDLSRVGHLTGEAVEVDLAELAMAVIDEAAAANPGMAFKLGRLPVVTADPTSFRQLLTNLVDNAVQHGGRPDLRVAVDGSPRPDGGFELTVRDDGKGIPPEHRERVFGVFERLDGHTTSGGTGMGLAICRKIVELLGGSITIQGDDHAAGPGGTGGAPAHRGTTVRVVLPGTVPSRWPGPQLTGPPRERGALLLRERGALA